MYIYSLFMSDIKTSLLVTNGRWQLASQNVAWLIRFKGNGFTFVDFHKRHDLLTKRNENKYVRYVSKFVQICT